MVTSDVLPGPVASALGISAHATISSSPQGMTSEVSFVHDHGRKSVLKRCRDPRYVEWLRREHRVLVALSHASLRIPRVIGYHERHDDGRIADAWLLMTRLPGESLWDVLVRSAPAERPDYFRKLGNALRRVHSTPAPAAFRNQRPWIDRALELARHNLTWCDGTAELLEPLAATRPAPVREVVIHGDLALDNVLIDRDGSLSLIDWSGGDLGDPRYDLSLVLATEPEIVLGESAIAALFDGYGSTRTDPVTTRWFRNLYEYF